ncbi:DUF3237 domain-containing protein [Nocardia crassostreae]|uniref:DUF3237 domain-containing protein n=1 Tax=Nocardia crassostreae TaxID=53428 RepID=UPI000832CA9C|nr:DUF3237 domain-containing protein [Nocardia crassostreae]
MDTRVKDIGAIETGFLFDIVIDLSPRLSIGGPLGGRTVYGSAGGSFEGPRIRGEVLSGGGDWGLYRPDGNLHLDVRVTLRADDADLVHMSWGGRWITPPELLDEIKDPARNRAIDPEMYYWRSAVLFETGSQKYSWLNDIVAVGSGYLVDKGVAYRVSEIH